MGDDALVCRQRATFESVLKSVEFVATAEPAAMNAAPFANTRPADTNNLPRASAPTMPDASSLSSSTVAPSTGLTWKAPSTWRQKPAGQMRLASYTIPGDGGEGDLSVTAFPGEAGGLLENVNRWRGQIKLAPLSSTDLLKKMTKSETHGLQLTVVDMVGEGTTGATRVLGAIVPYAGQTWFFKLTGPDAALASQKGAFADFLKTLQPTR